MSNTPTPPPAATDEQILAQVEAYWREEWFRFKGRLPEDVADMAKGSHAHAFKAGLFVAEKRAAAHTREAVSQAVASLEAERDALKIEYESRALWIDKMLTILDRRNDDGFHCVDVHEHAKVLMSDRESLRACVVRLRDALQTIADGVDEDDSGLTLRSVQKWARTALREAGREGGET